MSLKQTIKNYNQEQLTSVPKAILEALSRNASLTQQEIQCCKIKENALQLGDAFPPFQLNCSDGEHHKLGELLTAGPVIVSFYRGGWCPYCVLELKALNDIINQLPQLNATLVAVSPEIEQHAHQTKQENQLNFSLLRDDANQLALACGLVYTLPDEIINQYTKFGLDFKSRHNDSEHRLPIPATFILDQQGIIRYAFVEEDFMSRAEPTEIIKVLRGLEIVPEKIKVTKSKDWWQRLRARFTPGQQR
jgi:peroxiredoxin